jgi:hypothetical protein
MKVVDRGGEEGDVLGRCKHQVERMVSLASQERD